MLTEAISPLVRVNVPGFIVGRFSGDPHWPVLGDHCIRKVESAKRAFFHSPTVESFYSVDRPHNSRLRVVFDDRQTEVLQRIKGVHRAYGKLKQRLLDEPEVVFDGLMDAVEIRYGRRVEGIGALEAQSVPGASRSKSK